MNFLTEYEPTAIKPEAADSTVVQQELEIEENQLDGIVQEALQSLMGWSTGQDSRLKWDYIHDVSACDSNSFLDVQTSIVTECSEPVHANYTSFSPTIPQEVPCPHQYNNHPWLTDWNGTMHAHEIPNFIPVYEDFNVSHFPYAAVTSSSTQVKQKRRRTAYTTDQFLALESEFKINRYVNRIRRAEIARALNLPDLNVKVWFQNRRMKEKREGQKYSLVI